MADSAGEDTGWAYRQKLAPDMPGLIGPPQLFKRNAGGAVQSTVLIGERDEDNNYVYSIAIENPFDPQRSGKFVDCYT